MKTRIIIDSTADMTPEIKSRVYTVPLTVHFGREEYIDGVTIDHKTFYEKLIESDVLPTTSQATPSAFAQEYERARQAGEAAVVITLASKFSGTYQSAVIAAADYENVYVVDGASAAMGTGILVELAFRLLDGGMSAKEIAETLETEKKKIVVVALVDTLEYLKRGGRISKTAAFAGGLLNIKPVLSVIDGEIHLLGKARGSKMGNNLLIQEIDKAGGIDFSRPILLGYSGISDALLQKYIEDSRHIWEGNLNKIRYTTGREEYIDGVTIDHKTFYEKLIESDVLPTTSQATPSAFAQEYERARQAGEAAVVITLASKFSGTYQSAVIAAADYENVYVVDGASAAMGTGILVELAFRLLDGGMSAKEIAETLETEKKKIVVVALVDTLEYLKRGGRISKTAAFAGGLLNIKPVLSVIDGEIHLLGKARGSKMGNNLLIQEIDKAGGIDFSRPILLGYSGISDALLQKYIEDSRHIWEGNLNKIRYTTVGSVIGTHAGPGAVVVAFFKK